MENMQLSNTLNSELLLKVLLEYCANTHLMQAEEKKVIMRALTLIITPVWIMNKEICKEDLEKLKDG